MLTVVETNIGYIGAQTCDNMVLIGNTPRAVDFGYNKHEGTTAFARNNRVLAISKLQISRTET